MLPPWLEGGPVPVLGEQVGPHSGPSIATDGQAARWRESGFAPGARVERIREGVRITGTITSDGRVALDEPAHGESPLTSVWQAV